MDEISEDQLESILRKGLKKSIAHRVLALNLEPSKEFKEANLLNLLSNDEGFSRVVLSYVSLKAQERWDKQNGWLQLFLAIFASISTVTAVIQAKLKKHCIQ